MPAYQWLFSDHDRAIHHHRRYTRRQLVELLDGSFDVGQATYFNTVLFPLAVGSRAAWQTKRRLRGESGTPAKQSSQTGRFDSSFARVLEWEAGRIANGHSAPFGLSAVAIARRPEN